MDFDRTGIEKFNGVLFISCIAGALIGWLGAEYVYRVVPLSWPAVIQVGIYFAIVIFGVTVASFVSEIVVNRSKSSWTGNEIGRSVLFITASVLAFFLLGMLFQFIYGLGYTDKHKTQIDDYLFVIDNSGSTDSSDPDDLRFSAVEDLVRKLGSDKKFSITVFDDVIEGKLPLKSVNISSLEEMTKFFEQMKNLEKNGTEIQLVLSDVLSDYVQDGRSAAVIFLSDGESNSPVDQVSLGDAYLKKDLPIFCVAFSHMGRKGVKTMTRLSENTNGCYCEIEDLNDLQKTIENMLELTSKRSLLERRRGSDVKNIMALILRVLFIAVLGVLVEIVLTLILDYEELLKTALLIHIPFSVIAGLIAEFGMRILSFPNITRLLMCIFMSIVAVSYMEYTYSLSNSWDMDNDLSSIPSLGERKAKSNSDLKKRSRNGSRDKSSLL